jgi:hypothetical protein
MIGGRARFPTQGVGFRAETLIMPVRPAFGCLDGAWRTEGLVEVGPG